MFETQTVFLTSGWQEWEREFLKSTAAFQQAVPNSEYCWISVGERPDDPHLHVTIVREKRTWIATSWQVFRGDKPGTYRYERQYEGYTPTTAEVTADVMQVLRAPESQHK